LCRSDINTQNIPLKAIKLNKNDHAKTNTPISTTNPTTTTTTTTTSMWWALGNVVNNSSKGERVLGEIPAP